MKEAAMVFAALQLSYDELTVLLSALSDQVARDRGVLANASSPTIIDLTQERVHIARSLITACLEARQYIERPHVVGGLEPLRVLWEQTETTTAPWR